MAAYAAAHEQTYRRIEAIAEVSGRLHVLDMTREDVRAAVAMADSASDL
ncbi:MAG TPA: hypothetical protein VMV99_07580 [Rhodanobacter sp.]|nr:hypothetical protein [Rhodanobacter sp.]